MNPLLLNEPCLMLVVAGEFVCASLQVVHLFLVAFQTAPKSRRLMCILEAAILGHLALALILTVGAGLIGAPVLARALASFPAFGVLWINALFATWTFALALRARRIDFHVRRPAHGPVHTSGHHRAQHAMEPNCPARPNLVPVPRTFWNHSRSRQTLRGPLGTQHGRNVNGNARGRTGHRPHRRIHLYERANEGMPLCIGVALRPRRSDPAVDKPFRNRPRLGR